MTQVSEEEIQKIGPDYNFQRKIVWKNAIGFLVLHILGIFGFYMCLFAKVYSIIWMVLLMFISGVSVTIGAHRMYAHRALKGKFILRVVLILLFTVAGQNCLYIWVRDHRQHHKFSDTDADPHNAHRGFFFSHIGWLMSRKHPLVISKGINIDLSDLEADWLVMFQKEFYKTLYVILALTLPVVVPVYYWNETYVNSLFVCFFARNLLVLNSTWSINSVAHLYGNKPFDKYILPGDEKLLATITLGEGFHNYHHVFPWDYRASELGGSYNISTNLINILNYFGLAYDLKVASEDMITARCIRTGDGTHSKLGSVCRNNNPEKLH